MTKDEVRGWKTCGAALRAARLEAGLSQQDVADAIARQWVDGRRLACPQPRVAEMEAGSDRYVPRWRAYAALVGYTLDFDGPHPVLRRNVKESKS